MNLNTHLLKYLTRDNLVDMLTKYELYYQISLGNYIYETIQDMEETMAKIKELDLRPSSNDMVSNYIEILHHFSYNEDFEEKEDYYIRTRALMHALKDFVNTDTELMHKKEYAEQKSEEIVHDRFFNESMRIQFESEYAFVHEEFDFFVNEELITLLRDNLEKGI